MPAAAMAILGCIVGMDRGYWGVSVFEQLCSGSPVR